MKKRNLHKVIGLLFTLLYTKGLWNQHFDTFPTRLLSDILSVGIPLLFIFSYKAKLKTPPFIWCIPTYISFVILSSVFNEINHFVFYMFRYYRDFFYIYLIFIFFWNVELSIKQICWLNKLLFFLFFLQIIASLIEIFVFNQRNEGWVGFITHTGGEVATIFSIWALAFIVSFGYYNSILLMLIGLLMPFIGYASGKRAIFFFVPITLLFVFISHLLLMGKDNVNRLELRRFTRNFVIISSLLFISLPVITYMVSTTNFGFGMHGAGAIGSQPVNAYLGSALYRYVTDETYFQDGASGDRLRTTERIINNSLSSVGVFFFGTNPFGVLDYNIRNTAIKSGIYYGFTGFTTDLFSNGFFSALCSIIFIFGLLLKVIKINSSKWSYYWKGIKLGVISTWIVALLIYFCYSADFLFRPCFIFIQIYFTSLLLSPINKFSKSSKEFYY